MSENKTKYQLKDYLDTGFYSDASDCENHKEKVVKCRKEHVCPSCQNEIKKGDYALSEIGFMDGFPVSCHTCIPCLDSWLDEMNFDFLEVDEERN